MQVVLVLHNLIRWAVLLFGVWTFFNSLAGVVGKRIYTRSEDRTSFLFTLSCDIQLLLGLALYFSNQWFERLKNLNMKDTYNRFFSLEHASMMIIAWILVHAGRVAVKKSATPQGKHKKALIFFGLAILLILAAIPWPFRETVMRPLYRWFN